MKLEWKRAGCVSIAGWRGFTFVCQWIGKMMSCDVIIRRIDGSLEICCTKEDPSAAEDWCEDWIDQQERPEWNDVTGWLSWAEWRGWRMFAASVNHGSDIWKCGEHMVQGYGTTINDAKAAAEKWVREQGAQE